MSLNKDMDILTRKYIQDKVCKMMTEKKIDRMHLTENSVILQRVSLFPLCFTDILISGF